MLSKGRISKDREVAMLSLDRLTQAYTIRGSAGPAN